MKDEQYYKTLDKRTKEYKEYKQSRGLGDTLEKVFKATGVEKVVKAITKDCGCDERKKKLNNIFPRQVKAVRCFTDKQLERYGNYINTRTLNIWNDEEISLVIEMYQHIFAIRYNPNDFCRTCQGTAKKLLKLTNRLDEVYNEYKK